MGKPKKYVVLLSDDEVKLLKSMMKKPIDTSSLVFRDIINDGYLYVDKAEYIYNIVKKGGLKNVFCSRPRRFGKSLTLSTLE